MGSSGRALVAFAASYGRAQCRRAISRSYLALVCECLKTTDVKMRSARHDDDDYEDENGALRGRIFRPRRPRKERGKCERDGERERERRAARERRRRRRGAGTIPGGAGCSREVRRIEPRFTAERIGPVAGEKEGYTSGVGRDGRWGIAAGTGREAEGGKRERRALTI